MVRLAFATDVHVHNPKKFGGPVEASLNRRCRQILDVLAAAADTSADEDCDAMFTLGDLYETHRPTPQMIVGTVEALSVGGLPIYAFAGNHDQVSTQRGDHALGPLQFIEPLIPIAGPRVVSFVRKRDTVSVICVPFRPGVASEWLPGVLEERTAGLPRGPRILLLHMGIRGPHTSAFLRKAPDAIDVNELDALCVDHDIECVFAGHWHDRYVAKGTDTQILQLGALVPNGFRDPGLDGYGTLAFWDDGEVSLKEIPGPRFLKVTSKVELMREPLRKHQTYLSIQAPPDDLNWARQLIDQAVEAGDIVDGEALPAAKEVKQAAHDAATAASSTETLDEAVAVFVAKMSLDEGVDRDAVLARSKEYLK